jgi:hypothetical protein
MTDWHCRIGKVRPRLGLYRDDKVIEPDWWDEGGFIEELIGAAREGGSVRGYSVTVAHEDGSVTRGTKVIRPGSDFQMLGAVTYEMVRLVQRIQEGRAA